MANLKFSNFGKAQLAIAPVGTSGLTFTVEAAKGALFPTLGAGEYFYGIFKDASLNYEIVKIEARSTDLFTIESGGRGIDGTTARTWLANDYFVGALTRIALNEFIPSVTTQQIGLTTLASDKLPYFDSSSTAATTDFTSLARTLLAGLTTAAMRSTLDAVSKTIAETIGGKKTFSASVVQAVAGDVTAAATIDLTAAVGNSGDVIGNTGITAVTLEDGKSFLATFISNPLLTHHATNLNINNGGGDYQTEAGDAVLFHAQDSIVYGKVFRVSGASGLPVGSIIDYGGTTLPAGYIECDGASLLRAGIYANLFTAIGVIWGNVDGTHFNAPDLRRRTTIGKDGTSIQSPTNGVGDTNALGTEQHTLITAETPAHVHGVQFANTSGGGVTKYNATSGAINNKALLGTVNTESVGSGNAHNNMQPSAVVMKIIKYQ